MTQENINISVTQTGATEVRRDLNEIAQSARSAQGPLAGMDAQIRRLQAAMAATAGPTSQLRNAISSLGPSAQASILSLQGVGTSARNSILGLQGLNTGARASILSLQNLGSNARASILSLQALGPATAFAGSGLSGLAKSIISLEAIRRVTSEVFQAIDSWIKMSNRLRQVSTDTDNLVASQNAVYESAQRTRSGMEEIATLYTRTAMATENLGLSQREVMDITETVARAMKLNGGSVQEAANAMRQLSQAFNKGKLDGDEFRSIMENAPQLQKAFADGLNVSKAKLYEMSAAGELTLPKLIASLQKAGPKIRESFEGSLPLISEGFTYLGNSVTQFIGKLDEATGFSRGFYNVMVFIGDNIGVLGITLAGIAAALAIAFGPAAVAMVSAFGVMLWTAIGGPIGFILIGLAMAAAAVYAFGDSWKVTADGITVLDYIRAALQVVGEYVGIVARYIGDAFTRAWDLVTLTWGTINSYFGDQLGTLGTFMQNAVGTFLGIWRGLYLGIVAAFETLPAAFRAIFQLAINGALAIVENGINAMLEGINLLFAYLQLPLIPKIDLSGFRQEVDTAALGAGKKIIGAFNQGLQEGKDLVNGVVTGLGAAADKLTDRARLISQERKKLEANQPKLSDAPGINSYVPPADTASVSKAEKEVEKLENQLKSLIKTIDPLSNAQQRLKEGTELLDKAYAKGLITLAQRNDLMSKLKKDVNEQINSLSKTKLDKKDSELGKLERQFNSLLKIIDPLASAQHQLKEGAELLDQAYAKGLIPLQRRNELLKKLQDHFRTIPGPMRQMLSDMNKEADLLRLGNQEREVQRDLLQKIEQLRQNGVNLGPIEVQQLEQSIRSLQDLKEQSELLDKVLERVFKGAEDAFVQFIETGKINFSELITSLISDIARLAFQSFVTKPLTNMLGTLLGGLLGGGGGGGGGSGLGGLFGGLFGASKPSLYATGGSFTVGGAGGVDSQLVQFRASPGERVNIERAGSNTDSSRPQVIFNIQTPNVESFRASEAQLAARMARLASRGNRNL